MMRAVRFSAQLGYDIEKATRLAICELSQTLEKISAERIRTELLKLLVSPHPEMLRICRETGMTAVFLPEFDQMAQTVQNNPHHCYDVAEHTIQALMHSAPEKRCGLLFYFMIWEKRRRGRRIRTAWIIFMDIRRSAPSWQRTILRRLKFDNETIDRVVRLVRAHDVKIEPGERNMRFALNRLGPDLFPELFFW